ncbi:MAG TPA: hypothetical protein ENK83_01195 [Aliiroseovarius sp.]|nr:hypothetical protein [Aliiroseovarius sp.]
MFLRILTGVPYWVWPLFVLLLALGLIAIRDRTRSAIPLYFLCLLGLLSLRSVYRLSPDMFIWGVFGLTYVAGAWLGARFQKRIIIAKVGQRITVKGEWLTLVVVMTVFWMSFASGVLRAVAPQMVASPVFQAVFATLAGLSAGSFIGRAVRTYLTPPT